MTDRACVLWLLLAQALLGAFDTLYFHEWRARLPALGRSARDELRLHWARSMIYAFLFAVLPWLEAGGAWAWLLMGCVVAEVFITVADFVVEDRVRLPRGGVYPGERATHTVMAILHGAILAFLLPLLWKARELPTAWVSEPAPVAPWLRWTFALLAAGVFLSGVRDLVASTGARGSSWPWPKIPVGAR